MRSFEEQPVPPWGVAIEYDGCLRGYVALPQAVGTHEECAQFIANHLPPRGYEFNIYPTEPARLRSFLIPPPTVARRIRLHIQDCTLA